MTDKSDGSQLMTSGSRDVQLTNHRRQLSADSTSSLQNSLLLVNADDVELNRFTRHHHNFTSSPVMSETIQDVSLFAAFIVYSIKFRYRLSFFQFKLIILFFLNNCLLLVLNNFNKYPLTLKSSDCLDFFGTSYVQTSSVGKKRFRME